MDSAELKIALTDLGLDANRLVAFILADAGERPLSEVAYNVVVNHDAHIVVSGVGRGKLSQVPLSDTVFRSESDACEFVWRRIRTVTARDTLSEDEITKNRGEAEAILAKRARETSK